MNTCYKIVTGTNSLNDGYLAVLLDHGSGYVIEKASTWYGKGVTVYEKCVPSSTKLAVENKNENANNTCYVCVICVCSALQMLLSFFLSLLPRAPFLPMTKTFCSVSHANCQPRTRLSQPKFA